MSFQRSKVDGSVPVGNTSQAPVGTEIRRTRASIRTTCVVNFCINTLQGVRRVSEGSLDGVWKVSGGCLEGLWKVSGGSLQGARRCLGDVCRVLGGCFEGSGPNIFVPKFLDLFYTT